MSKSKKIVEFESKKAFIRAQPAEASAEDVIELGKTHGFEIDKKYIWSVRSEAKALKEIGRAKRGPYAAPAAPAAPAAAPAAAAPAAARSVSERDLRSAIVHLGIVRAEEIFEHVRHELEFVISPRTD